MRLLEKVLTVLAVPVAIMNALGAIVSGVWLLFLGEWSVLLAGLIYILFASFVIGLVLIPGLLLSKPLVWFYERKNVVGVAITGTISLLYTFAVMVFSSYYIFDVILSSSEANIWILLIWAFSAAVAPWAYMANKEQDNEGTIFSLAALNYALIIAIILIGGFSSSVESAFTVVTYFMLIPLVPGIFIAVNSLRNRGQAILEGKAENTTRFTNLELQAFVMALLYLADADDNLHENEINEIQQCFESLTKERVSKKFIKQMYTEFTQEPIDIQYFRDLNYLVDNEMKTFITEGMCYVATSDDRLHAKEKKVIVEVSVALGMKKTDVARVYREALNN